MHCPHCRAVNEQTEERCVHCGRRLDGGAPGPFPIRNPNVMAATAPALDVFAEPETASRADAPETPNYQPSLFTDGFRDGTAGSKVIPIPTLTPLHPYHRDRTRVQAAAAIAPLARL